MHYNSRNAFVGETIATNPLHALVLSRDGNVIGVLRRVLDELKVEVEVVTGPERAAEELSGRRFDAVLIDCDDVHNAAAILRNLHHAGLNQHCAACAIINGITTVNAALDMGANLALQKPLVPEAVRRSLDAIFRRSANSGNAAEP